MMPARLRIFVVARIGIRGTLAPPLIAFDSRLS